MRVAVIGAGIVGLSSALCILQTFPGTSITVFSHQPLEETTTSGCAGMFTPNFQTSTSSDLINEWGVETWKFVTEEARKHSPQVTGVYPVETIYLERLLEDGELQEAFHYTNVTYQRRLSVQELAEFPSDFCWGLQRRLKLIEGDTMQAHILHSFQSLGGQLHFRTVDTFDQLIDENYQLIVNCSGLAAGRLCHDPDVYPIRGQILRVKAPWVKLAYFVESECTYIIPRKDFVVVGGTHQDGDWSRESRSSDSQDIMERAARVLPELKSCEILSSWAGLRPGRKNGIRLEAERRQSARSKDFYWVYHNYGHGGSGMSLFWGTALAVTRLIGGNLNSQ